MSDLIERQAAIDALNEVDDGASISTAITVIEELPSAQPEPLTVNIAREMDRETIEKLKESLKNAPVLIMAVNDSAQPERTCENCRYLYMEWADEPCDSCTFENSHWKPIVQPEPKWIPCSERLPEDDTLMLVNYIDRRPDAMDIWIGWHEMENVWYIDGEEHSRERGNEVIAWRELPEPWRGEEHECMDV